MGSVGWAAALLAASSLTAGARAACGEAACRESVIAGPVALAAPAQELTLRGPEPAVVELGGEAILTLSLDGAATESELVPPPDIAGLELRIGPPERSSFQTVTEAGVEV